MKIDTAKLCAIIPELESWTGGERRDLDAKIAEACGWTDLDIIPGWVTTPDGYRCAVPHYLGKDPSIATEDMQRLIQESGYLLCMSGNYINGKYGAIFEVMDRCSGVSGDGDNAPLAFACAVIAKEDGK